MSVLILIGVLCGIVIIVECIRAYCFRNRNNEDIYEYIDFESDTSSDNGNPYRI